MLKKGKNKENMGWKEPRFEDCGFLKVKINKLYTITDHGLALLPCWPTFKVTIFVFHKILFTVGIIFAIIYDIRSQVLTEWQTPAI
jgi:hypothetical protein